MNFDDQMGSCRDKGWGGAGGAWCLSWWQREPVGIAWSNQIAPQPGQAPGPLLHSPPPLVPTGPWTTGRTPTRTSTRPPPPLHPTPCPYRTLDHRSHPTRTSTKPPPPLHPTPCPYG